MKEWDIVSRLQCWISHAWTWSVENLPPEIVGAMLTALFVLVFISSQEKKRRSKYLNKKIAVLMNELEKSKALFKDLGNLEKPKHDILESVQVRELYLVKNHLTHLGYQIHLWQNQILELIDTEKFDKLSKIEQRLLEFSNEWLNPTISYCENRLMAFAHQTSNQLLIQSLGLSESTADFLDTISAVGNYGERVGVKSMFKTGNPVEQLEILIGELSSLHSVEVRLERGKNLVEIAYEARLERSDLGLFERLKTHWELRRVRQEKNKDSRNETDDNDAKDIQHNRYKH